MGKRSRVMKAGDGVYRQNGVTYEGKIHNVEPKQRTFVDNVWGFSDTIGKGFYNAAATTADGVKNAAHGVGRVVYDTASETRIVQDSSIEVGRKVFAMYENKNWYPAIITKKNTDGTYEVKYIKDKQKETLNKDNIRLLFPDYETDQTDTTDSRVEKRLRLYNHSSLQNGVLPTIGTITYNELSSDLQRELQRIINGGYLLGGKSRKQRKSHKNNKSRKNRKSRKDRK